MFEQQSLIIIKEIKEILRGCSSFMYNIKERIGKEVQIRENWSHFYDIFTFDILWYSYSEVYFYFLFRDVLICSKVSLKCHQ